LDLTVTVKPNESLKFEHFKKPAKKNIFINYKSALPEPMKINIIRNERKRISERCSSNQSIRTHNIKFDNLLSSNGYPTHIIDKSYHPQQTSIRNPTNDFHYLKIPFICEELNWKLKSVFRSEGIAVRFYHPNKSLRSLLKRRESPKFCTSTTCKFKSSGLCLSNNVVYQIGCTICQEFYIGSTIRSLHNRLAEHLRDRNSSVFQHLQVCESIQEIHQRLKVKILTHDNDPINLRIKEAILIKQKCPKLNSREEMKPIELLI
jgi:hypothetical protein